MRAAKLSDVRELAERSLH